MNQAAKDALAKEAIESVVKNLLGRKRIRKVIVNAVADYSGEPSLYVNVHLKQSDSIPNIEQISELRDTIRRELAQIQDDRFPYISVIGSHWESATGLQPHPA